MSNYGIISLLPVILALILAFWKRNVFIALLTGVFTGAIIIGIKEKSFFIAFDAIAEVFTSVGTAKTTFFLLITGAIVYAIQRSGGVEGLVYYLTEKKKIVKSKMGAQLLAMIVGVLIFVDGTTSIVISAIVGEAFFEKYKIPKEKLALISNSTGSPVTWIVPFGAAGAMLISVINEILPSLDVTESVFSIVIKSMAFQFYSIALLVIVLASILLNKDFSAMKKRGKDQEKAEKIPFKTDLPKGKEPLARNMVLPIVFLILSILSLLLYTGNGSLINGDASTAIFTSGLLTLFFMAIYYAFQKIVKIEDFIDWSFEGMKDYLPIIIILVLAYAFSDIVGQLGTAAYIASFSQYIPASAILIMALVISTFISFSSGSSSASVILLVPLMLPIAVSSGIPLHYVLAALISGAVFGDQSSPISDSVILTAKVTNTEIMSHVKTQLWYTIPALILSAIFYIVLGFTL
ncbi:MAG: hypothetical protein L0L39_04965 [Atopostipes suicloacalis]|nr:hypothetical protein [Atopostipes suicloacalis]